MGIWRRIFGRDVTSATQPVAKRAYEAATRGRRGEGWLAGAQGPTSEIAAALPVLRQRSRDLVRNNPYAAAAVAAYAANVVDTGITARAVADDEALARRADELWARWTSECDADGVTDFGGLQALVVRAMVESGECLVRIRERRVEDGLVVPLQLQLIEADHLDSQQDRELPNGGYISQGIEFDALGRRVAYWLFPRHPGEVLASFAPVLQSRRVLAADVLHVFVRQRPGQIRGVPWMAPVMMTMRNLDVYQDAEMMRKKVESCFAAFVIGAPDDAPLGVASTDASGERVERLAPGMIEYLKPGEDVRFNSPASSSGYNDYVRAHLFSIAAGIGVPYELLTGDLSQVNYSSIRMGLHQFLRRVSSIQWHVMVHGLCAPVWARFISTAQQIGVLPDGMVTAEWTAPKAEPVDPLKDVKADIAAVRAGLMSLPEAIARQGYDPARVLSEIAATAQKLDKLGLILDSDPRRDGARRSTTSDVDDESADG